MTQTFSLAAGYKSDLLPTGGIKLHHATSIHRHVHKVDSNIFRSDVYPSLILCCRNVDDLSSICQPVTKLTTKHRNLKNMYGFTRPGQHEGRSKVKLSFGHKTVKMKWVFPLSYSFHSFHSGLQAFFQY